MTARKRLLSIKLDWSAILLIAAITVLYRRANPASPFVFRSANGRADILTWARFSHATDHPRPFGLAVMLKKVGWLVIPVVNATSSAH